MANNDVIFVCIKRSLNSFVSSLTTEFKVSVFIAKINLLLVCQLNLLLYTKHSCTFVKLYMMIFIFILTVLQPLFKFEHPNWENKTNERFGILKFRCQQNCVLTGFAGFFETVLYKDIMLSINPQTFSENMVSWFPIIFPLQVRINTPTNLILKNRSCSRPNLRHSVIL